MWFEKLLRHLAISLQKPIINSEIFGWWLWPNLYLYPVFCFHFFVSVFATTIVYTNNKFLLMRKVLEISERSIDWSIWVKPFIYLPIK